jgi:hypothetical protein
MVEQLSGVSVLVMIFASFLFRDFEVATGVIR